MLKKSTKNQQLRVRITPETRAALEVYARSRTDEVTLSDVIREFIQYMAGSDGKQIPVLVSAEAYEVLTDLSLSWTRTKEQTVDQCIFEINDLLKNPRIKTPLIVREIQLRRTYQNRKEPAETTNTV